MAIRKTSRQIACFGVASLVLFTLFCITCRATQRTGQDLLDDFWDRSKMDPDPNAGVVLRVDLDIDGDGLKDLLLANGQRMGSSGFAQWFVYRALGDGVYRCLGSFASGPKSFRVLANPSRAEVLVFRAGDA